MLLCAGRRSVLAKNASLSGNAMIRFKVEEAHCYVVQCRRIVCGQYVAD